MHEKIGRRGRDVVSGFTGTIVGRTEWLTGCATLALAPNELHEGKPVETQWFDETRVVVLGSGRVELVSVDDGPATGGPHETPRRGRG